MYKAHSWRNAWTRFGAVALSVDWFASDVILRLSALKTSMEPCFSWTEEEREVDCETSPQFRRWWNVEKSPYLCPLQPSTEAKTGQRYEEGKYSGPIVLVFYLNVAQFSLVTLVLYVRGPCMT